jgi:dolichyl-phosphate beta-glucosyltransferase
VTDSPSLSVIIPAFNEEQRLGRFLEQATDYLDRRGQRYEILVVDDGSTDRTAALVESIRSQHPAINLLRLPTNQGKGAAVRHGMRVASGQLQLFADADGAAPMSELVRLEQAMVRGADLAIGSRALASRDSRYRVDARWHRTVLGNLFNRLVSRLGIAGIADTQCGFKLFTRKAAQDLFSVSCLDGYGIDLELLYVAQRRGYRITEVPINWADQAGSKVRVVRDGFRMLRELWGVRRNHAQGRYALTPFSETVPASALSHERSVTH